MEGQRVPEDPELTDDGFLGGRLRILQPLEGYRAATDPVLLAAAVAARPGESVLDLGCGVGVAALCLATRVPGLGLAGVERQADYAALARQNAARNGVSLEVVEADLATLPADLRARSFDHVLTNPPYYPRSAGTPARDPGREAARREETPLPLWLATATRRLRPGGTLTLIQSADRLPDTLAALPPALGSLVVLPLSPRLGRAANRFLLAGRKGGRAAFRLLSPFVLHDGMVHDGDRDLLMPAAQAILRNGAPLALLGP